LQISKLVIFLF